MEFIVDHFTKNIAGLLQGETKAMVVTSGRPQAVRYKLAFDKHLRDREIEGIKALVAFSGKVPGKLLGKDDERAPLGIDVDMDYTEANMNPDASGELRNEFEKSEHNVMIVANKFQTGFNQPKLVAMYLDKKVSGVEAVQTLSRLNRTYPGKDETFVIDFVNDKETILAAFRSYDDGAEMESVQDLDVVYDMKDTLDEARIYAQGDLVAFMKARGKALKEPTSEETLHKKLYAATQRPTDIFNNQLKVLSEGIEKWDHAIDRAIADGDENGRQKAEARRSELTKEREGLMLFKISLARFVRVYNYIAQLVDLDDASLENFAAFAKLFSKRLKGVAPEQIDLAGLVLAGIRLRKLPGGVEEPESDPELLQPIEPGTPEPSDREKEFIREIIKRMNDLFGDVADDTGQRHFTAQIAQVIKNNPKVREQVEKNTREQALQGDLPEAVKKATVDAMKSHNDLARALLKDQQNMEAFLNLIYDLMKSGGPEA